MEFELIVNITIFVIALFLGIEVIGKVPATLHTPLMSGANSIHGVVIVGVILAAFSSGNWQPDLGGFAILLLIFLAGFFGTANVVGGFVVTDRMLEMFKSKKQVQDNATKSNSTIGHFFKKVFKSKKIEQNLVQGHNPLDINSDMRTKDTEVK